MDPAMEQDEPGIVRGRCPIIAMAEIKLINLSPERRTFRTTMHSSS